MTVALCTSITCSTFLMIDDDMKRVYICKFTSTDIVFNECPRWCMPVFTSSTINASMQLHEQRTKSIKLAIMVVKTHN